MLRIVKSNSVAKQLRVDSGNFLTASLGTAVHVLRVIEENA